MRTNNGFHTKTIVRGAVIAALYVALSLLANALNLAYGPVQFRFSEALTVLPFLFPESVWGLTIGCLLTNVISPYGMLDLVVGTLATFLAAFLTARCRSRFLAPLPPVLCNAVLVGALIAWMETNGGMGFAAAFAYNALTVGAGELVVCYALGLPLLKVLENRGVIKTAV